MADREGWTTVEVWVAVDASGEYAVGPDSDAALGRYENDIGGDLEPLRMVQLTLQVELPREIELTGEAPLVGTGAKLTVAHG